MTTPFVDSAPSEAHESMIGHSWKEHGVEEHGFEGQGAQFSENGYRHLPEETTFSTAGPEPYEASLPLTDFAALEQRVLLAVNLVRRERQDRAAAEQRIEVLESHAAALEIQQEKLKTESVQLHQEIESLRGEREQVRQRIDRLLGQLDALEL